MLENNKNTYAVTCLKCEISTEEFFCLLFLAQCVIQINEILE